MWHRVWTVATGALMLSGSGVLATGLPTYEVTGFPITQHQLAAVNTAYVQERSPDPTLTLNGMPASPVQVLVLTPRSKHVITAKGVEAISELAGSAEPVAVERTR